VAGLCLLWPCERAGAQATLKPMPLQIGFTRSCFLNINRNDAEASFKALTEIVGRRRGYSVTSEVRIFDDDATFEAAIRDGSLIMAVADSWQYVAMTVPPRMKPQYISTELGKVGRRHLLLTRAGAGLNTLADLRGKSVLYVELANVTAGRKWLDTILLENQLGAADAFFGGVEAVAKPSLAVLPVFFGRKDACLVDESGFEVMKELNPQVGKGLVTLAVSESFVNNVILIRHDGWRDEKSRQDFIELLGELHLEPAGQQILTLFKVGELLPFDEKQLDTVRALRARHDGLTGHAGNEPR
jgi:ABC-type phosphate/phosphonate transport system substrate-binding protein